MAQRWPKYQYTYDKDDYPFNLRYKWMRFHQKSPSQQAYPNVYFVEMLTNSDQTGKNQILPLQVQQLTPEMCLKIDEALEQGQIKVFVRITTLHGHYINLEDMTLINLINQSSRRIFNLETLPNNTVIYHPITMTSMNLRVQHTSPIPTRSVEVERFNPQQLLNYEKQILQSKLQDMGQTMKEITSHEQQIHWMELIAKNKHSPLKESLSNEIEKCFQLYQQNLSTGLTEIYWQNQRYILDLKTETLVNIKTSQIKQLKRVNLNRVINLKTYLHKLDSKSVPKKDLVVNEDIIWQYEKKTKKQVFWTSYDKENQQRLEKKFRKWTKKNMKKNKTSFCIKCPSQQFYVDFEKMIEYDPLKHETTNIRRMVLNESII